MAYKILRWHFIQKLGSLTSAITLILMIATISIIGTVIEQNKPIDYYQLKYPATQNQTWALNWEIITKYHLNELYTSPFFLGLLLLFSLSLIICTLSRQLPSLKNAKRWKMKKSLSDNHKMDNKFSSQDTTICLPIYALSKNHYYTFYQKDTVYAYKGLHGRIGPIFVHISMILLLIGALQSLCCSFYIQAMIPIGESFSLHNITNSGVFSKVPDTIQGKINNFHIDYYSNYAIKQFNSSVQIKNQKNQHIKTETLSVNKPLKFENLTIYQTDWQINGIRIRVDHDKIIQIPVTEVQNQNTKYWFTSIKYNKTQTLSFVISNLQENIQCYDGEGKLIASIQKEKDYQIDHIPINILSILTSTGLQIKSDSGVGLIYISFFLLMSSIIISYMSFSQIWISKNYQTLNLKAKTNRAQLNLEEEIYRIRKYLQISI
uniref:Cytochrome c biogenesis protein Ccs1 n=1 Tax=Hommersandiophycus borowitzkae TaxID=268573 RepID=A0A1G4NTT6_9FLOR|nr:Cytochrome c biogenesis protein ccs1 [Hommersandiophycus borowitzkae]SCW22070.1 Cytochrome c biogenesis protein ccs1 [Hommersandiophycus borowitzkae]